ncbi:MAG: hypothetical protein EXS09_05020 [Gemmataceae bacterium]|nr:hypothetical protein [Gemmataceae bacterium]
MRILLCMLVFGLVSNAAPDPKKDAKPATVRVLDVKLDGEAKGKATEPTVITSAEELAKAIKDAAAIEAIQKAVDFKKEQVLLFQWAGSGQDKITFDLGEGDKASEVTFAYKRGLTRDLRQHKKLFVLPKDAKYNFAGK